MSLSYTPYFDHIPFPSPDSSQLHPYLPPYLCWVFFFFLKTMRSKVCYPNNLGYGTNPWSVVDAPRGQSLKANWLSLSQELPAFNSLQVGVGIPAHCPPFTLGLWMVWAFVTSTLSSYYSCHAVSGKHYFGIGLPCFQPSQVFSLLFSGISELHEGGSDVSVLLREACVLCPLVSRGSLC